MYSQWGDRHQVDTDSLYRRSSRFLRLCQVWLAIKQATVAILLNDQSTQAAAQVIVLWVSLIKDFELLAALRCAMDDAWHVNKWELTLMAQQNFASLSKATRRQQQRLLELYGTPLQHPIFGKRVYSC